MRYTMLLWPHANARYQAETEKLARAELEVTLARLGVEYTWEESGVGGLPALDFAARAFTDAEARVLSRHSLLYALFERREDGALLPLFGREAPRVGGDLPGILKYKGKTNEVFTQLLINLAWLAGNMPEKAHLFDPMCGRGTTLFVAINRGWDATGSDIDRAALREAEQFFKRYLEYHRFKHTTKRGSLRRIPRSRSRRARCALPRRKRRAPAKPLARERSTFSAPTCPMACSTARTCRWRRFCASPCPRGRKRSNTARPWPSPSTPRRCPRARCAPCLPGPACASSKAGLTIILNIGWSRRSRAISPWPCAPDPSPRPFRPF